MNTAPPTLYVHPSNRAEQTVIRLPLPIVEGNRDYRQREDELRRMDELLIHSGVEAACIAQRDADPEGERLGLCHIWWFWHRAREAVGVASGHKGVAGTGSARPLD